MKLIVIIGYLSLTTNLCFSQSNNKSSPPVNFVDFISGVKQATILVSEDMETKIKHDKNLIESYALAGLIGYLRTIGFEEILWGSSSDGNFLSLCDRAIIIPNWTIKSNRFIDIKLHFMTCNNDVYSFQNDNFYLKNDNQLMQRFQLEYSFMLGITNRRYSQNKRLSLPSEMTKWAEESDLVLHLSRKPIDAFEGIYTSVDTKKDLRLGVIKENGNYKLIYFSGEANYLDWKSGEVKATLTSTAIFNIFNAILITPAKHKESDAKVFFGQDGIMKIVESDFTETIFIKVSHSQQNESSLPELMSSSGSGFALTSSGIVVTNQHVIEGASSIKVRGISGDFAKAYNAKVVIEDKVNDIALLRINDVNFSTLGTIPYAIDSKSEDVGMSVFVLGYPLRATMGDEIKLTNGIISSKTGFKGDITSYQISAPTQPGNSGGPLFDEEGYLTGIVNAKHREAENASYAIKSIYLIKLLNSMSSPPKINTINNLKGKTLSNQVKEIKNYVYIIEVFE